MTQQDQAQERTEEPTEKRRSDAREKGQIPRSRELNTAFVLICGVGALFAFGRQIGNMLLEIMRDTFTIERHEIFDVKWMFKDLYAATETMLLTLLPLFIVLMVASLLGAGVLGGIRVNFKSLSPKLERLDPIAGFARIFSARGIMELIKALGKFAVIAVCAMLLLYYQQDTILRLSLEPGHLAIFHALTVLGWSVFGLACSVVLIAAIDVPFQLWDNTRQLKMTRQELKDEYKDTEGRPEIKSKIRQMQEEISKRKMLGEVPKADVVITNPTHYAVALRYDKEGDSAPVVVAKGVDFMALHIIKVAKANHVECFGAPPLARAIYYSTKLESEIPYGLYVAVAQILAYVYQIKLYREGKARKPRDIQDLPIPDELRH